MDNKETQKKIDDLKKSLIEKREALRKFRFDMTGGKIKNVRAGRNLRKEIARNLTAVKKLKDE